jgi:hypothetical protein
MEAVTLRHSYCLANVDIGSGSVVNGLKIECNRTKDFCAADWFAT